MQVKYYTVTHLTFVNFIIEYSNYGDDKSVKHNIVYNIYTNYNIISRIISYNTVYCTNKNILLIL